MEFMIELVIADMLEKLVYKYGLKRESIELHEALCSEGFFVSGRDKAKDFLGKNAFDAISLVKQWEKNINNKAKTDFSDPEEIANTFAYVVGGHVLSHSSHLKNGACNTKLTSDDLKKISWDIERIKPQDVMRSIIAKYNKAA